MRALLYTVLMVLLIPVLLIGLLFYAVPVMRSRGRVSGTAYEPFNGRLSYHMIGSRLDPAAATLAAGLPATNFGCMTFMLKPMVWASQVTGYVPSIFEYPPPRPTPVGAMVGARCEFLDAALLEYAPETEQLVVLGAGWDTRCYGLLAGRDMAFFEVDAPGTQAVKLDAIAKTGLDASHVTFVSCDFNRQSWLDALKEKGFDPAKRTFVLWEGVTMYLQEHAIESTLRTVATLPGGSHIAFDFMSREFIEGTLAGRFFARAAGVTYGEPFTFSFPIMPDISIRLGEYLAKQGLTLERAWALSADAKGGTPYAGLALAVTPE